MKFMHTILILSTIAALPINCHGESTPSKTIKNFLHEHLENQTQYNSISYTLSINRTEETSENDWHATIDIMRNIITSCEKCESERETHFIEAFGEPIKHLYLQLKDATGIHGNLTININNETFIEANQIRIKLKVYHEQPYDSSQWTELLHELLQTISSLNQNTEEFIEHTGTPLQRILRTPHIKNTLSILLKDSESKYLYNFELTK